MIGLISHPDCLQHETGPEHPEQAARLTAIDDQLIATGLDGVLRHYQAPNVTREQLLRVHAPAYIDEVAARVPQRGLVHLDPDTVIGPHSLAAALRAAGAGVLGVDSVMSGELQAAFCAVRPPGHHAERARAMGFCIFNNVAIAAAHALAAHGLQRVAIADFDVHHGNGTEALFRDDPRVLVCSAFQHPLFPHVGADSPHAINVPLPPGTAGPAFRAAVAGAWLEPLHRFAPELVLISAGFDGHVEDDMAGLCLVETDYAWVTAQIKAVADAHARGRVVSTLEGGYALAALGRSVAAHLNALLGG